MLVDVGNTVRRICLVLALITLGSLTSCSAARHANDPRSRANAQNGKELPLFPNKVPAESLRIDGAGLRAHWLLDLLSERNVQMLEISPTVSLRDPQRTRLAFNDSGQGSGEWLYPVASFMFIQLRLSHDGDNTCVADNELPSDMRYRIRRSPFLPDTCLSLTITSKSTARFHLRYNPNHEFGAPFAKWELFDNISGKSMASLTTVDQPNLPHRSRDFTVQNNQPYVALAALVDNRDAKRLPPYQVYQNRSVLATQHPFGSYPVPTFTQVKSVTRFVEYTKKEAELVFQEQWSRAIDEARKMGWGNYGQQLVDQSLGAVLRLSFGQNIFVYDRAADNGFYVFSGDWKYDQNNWLTRYDSKGTLIWQITVTPPAISDLDVACSAGVYALHTTADELIFEGRCRNSTDSNPYIAEEHQSFRQVLVRKRDITNALAEK